MLHTATSFSNGTEVVAIGGDNGPTIHNTVEIYNSVTNLWTTLTSMSMARTGHAATLIDNDKVVVTGGYVGAGVTATSVEIFDKNAMTPTPLWTTVTPMLAPRMYHTAHAETNSHGIFVIGGATGSLMFTNTVERYDIDLNTWSSKASMTNVRFGHQSIMLPETDNIIVIGGVSTPGGVGNVELYNNSLDSWSTKASMSFAARSNHTATLLQDGRILVTGGVGGAVTSPSTSVEAYNPATDTWQTLAPMNYGREFHTATLLSDGRLLVAGGNSEITKSVEIYDPILNRWTLQQNMKDGRYLHTASLLSDDKILLYGGLGAYDRLWSWEILFKNTILVP
jgi:N-acetylneuraminic acid mutarotase